jgi:hypothetical protein
MGVSGIAVGDSTTAADVTGVTVCTGKGSGSVTIDIGFYIYILEMSKGVVSPLSA